jgi:hypothetical protein
MVPHYSPALISVHLRSADDEEVCHVVILDSDGELLRGKEGSTWVLLWTSFKELATNFKGPAIYYRSRTIV